MLGPNICKIKTDKICHVKCLEASTGNLGVGKLHISYCKYVLGGVHRKASNAAVNGELGRKPICYDVIKNSMRFLYRSKDSHENSLLDLAYKDNLHFTYRGIGSWIFQLQQMADHSELSNLQNSDSSLVSSMITKMDNEFYSFWEKNV